ncbi:MAG: hypothetical protein LKF41_00825 [Bifidobacterium sp.]|jgi:MFS family permease|nr:hypothetical protein [Bifidobacterium sp.]MCH4174386.1 hypothetical protein [Bifidobacterium sp.]
MQYLLYAGIIIVGLAIGLFFGALPLRSSEMNDKQQKHSSLVGMVALGIVAVLIIIGQDAASWIAIASLFVGFGIGKIPALHRKLISRWPYLKAAPAKNHKGRNNGSAKKGEH